jgi:hypothetical protein
MYTKKTSLPLLPLEGFAPTTFQRGYHLTWIQKNLTVTPGRWVKVMILENNFAEPKDKKWCFFSTNTAICAEKKIIITWVFKKIDNFFSQTVGQNLRQWRS